VGSFPTGNNPQGVSDLAGNVWEWTSSMFDASGAARVDRGGGWDDDDPSIVRAASRDGRAPSYRYRYLGFRCARAGSP
jgi:formylglycine-generating enzyme required for sulfatase activity